MSYAKYKKWGGVFNFWEVVLRMPMFLLFLFQKLCYKVVRMSIHSTPVFFSYQLYYISIKNYTHTKNQSFAGNCKIFLQQERDGRHQDNQLSPEHCLSLLCQAQ